MSIGVVCNIYEEANALPGFLESASMFFDDICFYHTGPQGKYSSDGTIEIIEKWGARLFFGKIDDGFGTVRTQAIRHSNCGWVMILDADERFHMHAPVLRCSGDDLTVTIDGEPYAQGAWLKSIIKDPNIDAVSTIRRHWYDFTWRKPMQDWTKIPDRQLRIVRNIEQIEYKAHPKMHERIQDTRTGEEPRFFVPNMNHGPFHDHYHLFFKPMELAQRDHDKRIYEALSSNEVTPVE